MSQSLPLLLILFAGSGCAALIYEIVWYQMLQLAIGSTAVSLGVLLATFMGGLCIGSVALPRLRINRNPLRLYAVLELGIAICGILVLFGLPFIDRIYFASPNVLLRGLVAAVCMLPPTILMGASLPAIAGWIKSTPQGVSWLGWLYGGNTVGAVCGCLLAGFYLLRLYDVATATYAAAAINLAVAAISFAVASRSHDRDVPLEIISSDWKVYLAIGLSGACALGAEVIWTRLMGMMMGATVYVFSIILAVFLIGLAFGSTGGSWLVRRVPARAALGWSQILVALGIAWTAYMISDSLPYWPALTTTTPWQTLRGDLLRSLAAILPPAILWGASFPFALGALANDSEDSGRLVGGVYSANTLGAIVGALGTSLILIPWIGTQQSQRLLLTLSVIGAFFVLMPRVSKIALSVALVVCVGLAWRIHSIPGEVIAYGRHMSNTSGQVLYTIEGRNSSVAITLGSDGATEVDVNGHVEATTEPYDMKLQRMVGHLPAVLHPNPQSVLGIGFGAGVSAGTFTTYPGIKSITICEIEPVIPPTSTRYFAREDYDVMHNPRTRIVFDDARHYLLTTRAKFDVIASDPLDVFVKGTAALYSKEYFEAVKTHLNPGGMFTLYVPLYETDVKTIKSELATFFDAFPYGTIWANTRGGEGYDMVFMGQVEPLKINIDQVQQRLERPGYAPVAQSLREIGVFSAVDLFSTYTGGSSDLAPWLQGAEINRDRNLRLQYLAGWGFNANLADYLYREMLRYRKPPVNLFAGSSERMQALQYALSANGL